MTKHINFITLIIASWLGLCGVTVAGEQTSHVMTLSEVVSIAVKNNAIVKEAVEKIKSAQFENNGARSDMFPKLTANYSYTGLNDEPVMQINGMPPAAQIAHENIYHWDITLVQPLFTGFALSTRYDMSKLGVEIKNKEKQQVVLDVINGAKRAYYNVLLTKKLLFVADDTIKSLQSVEKDAQQFYNSGIIRLNDLLRAKVVLSNAVQRRETAMSAVQMAISDLNRWLSYYINQDTKITDIDTVPDNHFVLEALIEQGMKNRPVLQSMRLALDTFEYVVDLEKSAYYPEIAAIGSYQQEGDDPAATNNDYSNDHNAIIAFQAKWTFFDSFKTRAKVNKAKADKQSFKEKIRSVEDGIKLEIKNSYLNLNVAEKNIDTSKVTLTQAKENLRITNLGYHQQSATSTEVLDARADLTQAQTNYYMALYGYLDALAGLERAIGKKTES